MERYEKIEYDYIDSIGQWKTATVYELIDWNETETETETNKETKE